MKSNLFIQRYSKSAIGAERRLPRIDELPYFVTLPFVFILAKLRVHPNLVVLVSFFCSMVVVYGVFSGWHVDQGGWIIILIVIRVLLDCADGQLARYRSRTSALGALYDLISDFLFAILFFMAAAYSAIVHEQAAPLTSVLLSFGAFLSLVVSSTIASFFSRLDRQKHDPLNMVKAQFVESYQNDRAENRWYTVKLGILNRLFGCSWRAASVLFFSCLIRKREVRNREIAAQMTGFFEFGVHWIICSIILWCWQSLIIFLLFEILAFCSVIGLVLLLTSKYGADWS